jgi:acyl CoA:acetate/3-ketoacid CoA transferase alpha subunit
MDLSVGRRRISAEARAKRFADGRYLYFGGFNHRAAECAARKKTQTFKASGAEVKEVGIKECTEESGKD